MDLSIQLYQDETSPGSG